MEGPGGEAPVVRVGEKGQGGKQIVGDAYGDAKERAADMKQQRKEKRQAKRQAKLGRLHGGEEEEATGPDASP